MNDDITLDDDVILNIDEAADLLRMSRRSLVKLAQQGKVPAAKLSDRKWLFFERQLVEFVRQLTLINIEPVDAEFFPKKTPLKKRRSNNL